jgi:hypothetical protein
MAETMRDALAAALSQDPKDWADQQRREHNRKQRQEGRVYLPHPRETRLVGKVVIRTIKKEK